MNLLPDTSPVAANTVVVVDDDALLLSLMSDLMVDLGFTARGFQSADDALIFVMRHAADIRLVLTDLVMPGQLTGADLAHMLAKRYPGLPIIVTTGYGDEANQFGPAITFIPKPWSLDGMGAVVKSLIGQGSNAH